LIIKTNALSAATEAACLILSIDETVRNPQSEEAQKLKTAQGLPGKEAAWKPRGGMKPTKFK